MKLCSCCDVSVAEPDFVSMYEIGEFVYIFFREVSVEQSQYEKVCTHPKNAKKIIYIVQPKAIASLVENFHF